MSSPQPTPTLPPEVVDELQAGGEFITYWWAVGLGVAALLALWVTVRMVGGRTGKARRVRQVTGITVITVLLAMSVGMAANTYSGYYRNVRDVATKLGLQPPAETAVPTTAPAAGPGTPAADPAAAAPAGQPGTPASSATPTTLSGGVVLQKGRSAALTIRSRSTQAVPEPTYLYLPPGYDDPANATRRYPTAYLLHGDPGTSGDWPGGQTLSHQLDVLISTGAIPPMIMVMPDVTVGRSTGYTCRNQPTGTKAADYLAEEVPAAVDAAVRTWADVDHRVIGGMSSGGNCALDLFISRPTVFGSVISFMPDGGPGPTVLNQLARPEVAAPLKGKVGVIDVGSRDAAKPYAEQAAKRLTAAGVNVVFRVTPGEAHTWNHPRVALPYVLLELCNKRGWRPDPPRKV